MSNKNSELMPYALSVGKRMVNQYIQYGDYIPEESWGGEGQIYPPQMGIALLGLYKATNDCLFLDGVKAIIESCVKKQMPSGGWALGLQKYGSGLKFQVPPELLKVISNIEDLPPTVTSIRLMAEYRIITDDKSYDDYMYKGYKFLLQYWNETEGLFNEMLNEEALKLRAKPRNYLIYSYLCMLAISKIYPDAEKFVKPLYVSLKQTFEAMDEETYTLLYAEYAALIIQTEQSSDYVKNEVKQRIDNELVLKSKFIIHKIPGAFGHVDGLRGICLDEGHLRNSIGAAIVMKFYDEYVGENIFTNSTFYKNLTDWILNMYDLDKFYEFIDINTEKKQGLGTPGQFLPIFWILGFI